MQGGCTAQGHSAKLTAETACLYHDYYCDSGHLEVAQRSRMTVCILRWPEKETWARGSGQEQETEQMATELTHIPWGFFLPSINNPSINMCPDWELGGILNHLFSKKEIFQSPNKFRRAPTTVLQKSFLGQNQVAWVDKASPAESLAPSSQPWILSREVLSAHRDSDVSCHRGLLQAAPCQCAEVTPNSLASLLWLWGQERSNVQKLEGGLPSSCLGPTFFKLVENC